MSKIYLISPPKIELGPFCIELEKALKTGLVSVFQLRLKDYSDQEIIEISLKLKDICHKNNCLFIINDSYEIALATKADGVHLGVEDGSIKDSRRKSQEDFSDRNFIIGASCYDSKHLAMEAGEQGADYISFGAFFPSKTKVTSARPTTELVNWCDEIIDLRIVAIGGITNKNCTPIVKAGADLIAVISYVWDHVDGVEKAVRNLHEVIKKSLS